MTAGPGFIHVRVHTAYSLSEGAIRPAELVEACTRMGFPAVGIADTNNMFGALELSGLLAKNGIQPLIGCQLDIALPRPDDRGAPGRLDVAPVVLLSQSETGYRNLLRLLSNAYLATDPGLPPHVGLERLCANTEGILILTGGSAGLLGRLILNGCADLAYRTLETLDGAFPGRCYIELQRHGMEAERRTEPVFLEMAYARDLPLIATNEPFFGTPDMFEAHDALLCIAEGAYVTQDSRRRLTPDHHLKSAEEMRALFADLPEAVDNTVTVARRCAWMVEKIDPILPPFTSGDGRSETELLREKAEEGLNARLAIHVYTDDMDEAARAMAAVPYRERLDFELGIIGRMGFPGYFLIVADFIQWAKGAGIPVGPGRGSGAGSVVAWALTITDLDPLRFGLLFERFLNPERVSMPDFDIDFCQDRREEVIRYVQGKYGHDRVAQIITFGKLQARAVLRDVGRVLQMPYGQVDRLCKLVPNNPAKPVTLAEAIEGEPDLQAARDSDETVAKLIDIALRLEGLYRHASTHAAGVVIGDRPLHELVPLYRDPRSDMPVTQFNMKYVENAGLVKFDFLGLKTLTVLSTAVDLLESQGISLDLSTLPLDDETTYAMLGRGESAGVFQLESDGMRNVLTTMKPDCFEDIIAAVALYRPGPMENIPTYVARKHGREAPDYLYEGLKPILEETFGIMVYQEQVMQIAQEMAGYSLGEADLLRRAMGKKIQAEMDKQRPLFTEGAVKRGVPEAKAAEVFDLMVKFANYGFNKSHAAAYALVAYQTAYLKANHPVAFMAASMTLDLHNTDKLAQFKDELDRLGIPVLPPDVNASDAVFTVEPDADGRMAVRYALAALKNVGEHAMEILVAERRENGPFRSLEDLARRLDVGTLNKRQLENLAKAGAFDSLDANRARVFESAETLLKYAAAASADRSSEQASLFGGGAVAEPAMPLPNPRPWPELDALQYEREAIGFFLSAHPLSSFAKVRKRLHCLPIEDLDRVVVTSEPRSVRLAGIVKGKRERMGKNGKFAFLDLSDETGVADLVAFSEALARYRDLFDSGKPLVIDAIARRDQDRVRLQCQRVRDLETEAANTASEIVIQVTVPDTLVSLKDALGEANGGRQNVRLRALARGRWVEIQLPGHYPITPERLATLKSLDGVIGVEDR